MNAPAAHLRYVDGLRAVAVVAVIFYHGIGEARWAQPWLAARMSAQPAWWFATFAAKGAHGVDLFFVISGFCLAYPALERLHRGGATVFDVRRFLAKRIARIVPPYYVAIGVALAAALAAERLGLPRMAVFGGDHAPLSILKQLLFLDRGTDFVNGSFWTLGIEFRWYLAFPVLLLVYVRSQRAFFAILVGCVIAFNGTALRAIDIGTLPGFMLGIVAADWRVRGHRLKRYAPLGLLVALDAALLLEPFASAPSRFGTADDTGFFVQTNAGWQLASFCFVVAASEIAWLRRMLELRLAGAIGVAAYGIYLVHQPIVSWWSETWGTLLPPGASFAAAVLLAVAGGLVFSFVAERPLLSGRPRTWLLGALDMPLARFFAFAGLPGTVDLALRSPAAQRALMPQSAGSVERPIERAVS